MAESAIKIEDGKKYYIAVEAFQYHADTIVIEYKNLLGNTIVSEVDPTDLIDPDKLNKALFLRQLIKTFNTRADHWEKDPKVGAVIASELRVVIEGFKDALDL